MASRAETIWAVGQVDEEEVCFVCDGLVDGPQGTTQLDFGLVHTQCMQCHVCRHAVGTDTCHVDDTGRLSCAKHCTTVRNSMFLAPSFLRQITSPQPQRSQVHPSNRPHIVLVDDCPNRKLPPPAASLNYQVRQLESMAASMTLKSNRNASTRHSMGSVYEASLAPYTHPSRGTRRPLMTGSAPDIHVGPTGKVIGLQAGHVRLADAGMGLTPRLPASQNNAQGTPAHGIVMAAPDGQPVVVVPRHRRTATPVPSALQADRASSMQAREVQQEMLRALETYMESPHEHMQNTPCTCRQAAESRRGSMRRASVNEPLSSPDTPMVTPCAGWVVETEGTAQTDTPTIAGRPQGVHVLEDEFYFGRHFKDQSPALYGATCNGQPIILALLASPTTINRAMLLTPQHTVCAFWAPQALASSPDRVATALEPTLPLGVVWQPLQPQAEASLVNLEASLAVPGFKFGVVYAMQDQVDEEAMFGNAEGSAAFDEFLSCLGTKVALQGYSGFKGGLDTKHNTTGTHSVVATHQEKSVMFHVSTLLPHTPNCMQQLQRKRHIGNDMVAVVFVDGTTPFNPGCIPSHFLHGYVVVQPIRPSDSATITAYRMATVYRDTVRTHQPRLPHGTVQTKGPALAKTLLEKLVALETAVHAAPAFQRLTERTRDQLLRDMLTHTKTEGDIVRKRSNMKRLSATAATFRLSAMPLVNLSATIMRSDTAADTQQRPHSKSGPHLDAPESPAPSLPPSPTTQSLPLPNSGSNTSASTLHMDSTPSGPLPTRQKSFRALAMRLTRNSPLARFMAPKDRSKKPVEVVS